MFTASVQYNVISKTYELKKSTIQYSLYDYRITTAKVETNIEIEREVFGV